MFLEYHKEEASIFPACYYTEADSLIYLFRLNLRITSV